MAVPDIVELGGGQPVSGPLFAQSPFDQAVTALKRDLLAEGGPAISPMRNYRFAILTYRPDEEFTLRKEVRRLGEELTQQGWNVLSLSLQALLIGRLRAQGEDVLKIWIERERRTHAKDPGRALNWLVEQVSRLIEGEDGLAADVVDRIARFADDPAVTPDRTIVFIGRAGSLYPFFRSSSLLKHIDGKTRNLPVVLLYPGERKDGNSLSFMSRLPADRDYRPRIYS
jgi:hypothetical protein